jgi:hypothetical protein
MRQRFELPKPRFALPDIERYPGAKKARADFVKLIIERHGRDIFVAPGVLSLASSHEIYSGEPIGAPTYLRYRLREEWLDRALSETLEAALQTIAQLPSRYNEPLNRARTIKSIVSRLRKSSSELQEMCERWPDLDRRLTDSLSFNRVRQLAEEFDRVAKELKGAASTASKLIRFQIQPANPQVSLALYFCEFFKIGSGSQHYKIVETLTEAAFWAAGRDKPKWVDRLAVEMSRKRKLRQKWVRSITLSSPQGTSQK